jgi:hypothetical protein
MSDTRPTNASQPDNLELINNAILFCQDSAVQLAAARKLLNPMTLDPTLRHIVDSIGQLQNSMLDLLSWAGQVSERLANPSSK